MSLAATSGNSGSSGSTCCEAFLWYVRIMQHPTPPAGPVGVPARPRQAPAKFRPSPLSVVHEKALYRPVPPLAVDDDGYPYCDSSAVESTSHFDARAYVHHVVRVRFADRGDVFAAADLGLYFERGNPSAVVVPDAMVVFGVGRHHRLSYKLWEELKVPDLALEVASRQSWRKDFYDRPPLYADLGVREYWAFDPLGARRDGGPRLAGWRLDAAGGYEPVPRCPAGDGFVSDVLGLDVLMWDREFRLRDPATGEVLPDPAEQAARADEEAAKAIAAQRRVEELEALLREAEANAAPT